MVGFGRVYDYLWLYAALARLYMGWRWRWVSDALKYGSYSLALYIPFASQPVLWTLVWHWLLIGHLALLRYLPFNYLFVPSCSST